MLIREIRQEDILEVAELASECFMDDPYYVKILPDKKDRKINLINLFKRSIGICIAHGAAIAIVHENRFAAFLIAFFYDELKRNHPDDFKHIFPDSNLHNNRERGGSYAKISSVIGNSKEYLYLLALGVKPEHRRKGLATSLVKTIMEMYPEYSLLTDLSNLKTEPIYQRLGFESLGMAGDCAVYRYRSRQDEIHMDADPIKLAVPASLNTGDVFGRQLDGRVLELKHTELVEGPVPFFKRTAGCTAQARIITVSRQELLAYQRLLNVLHFYELKLLDPASGENFIVYITDSIQNRPIHFSDSTKAYIATKSEEWSIIPDCYISIPIQYEDIRKLRDRRCKSNCLMNRLLASLEYRTHYEAGIPVEQSMEGRNIRDRIKRFYLGQIRIQILSETDISFDGTEPEKQKICEPVDVALIVSVDKNTSCGVLHLVSLSCGLMISQFLDSMSRNQICVLTEEGVENLYTYLLSHFSIYKKGSAKAFLTVFKNRRAIEEELLCSLLFCETFYQDGELLGKVVDSDVKEILDPEYGAAQYNYASVFAYSNILLQLSENLFGTLTDRIVKESITLYYIELLMFEEAAINIANDDIIKFLTRVDDYAPRKVMSSVNAIISDHVKSIDFWNVKMNYPSSSKSMDGIREAFKIEDQRELLNRNLEQLQMIYDMRSDIIDKTESEILTTIGAILTVISVISLLLDSESHLSLCLATFTVAAFMLFKRYFFRIRQRLKGRRNAS